MNGKKHGSFSKSASQNHCSYGLGLSCPETRRNGVSKKSTPQAHIRDAFTASHATPGGCGVVEALVGELARLRRLIASRSEELWLRLLHIVEVPSFLALGLLSRPYLCQLCCPYPLPLRQNDMVTKAERRVTWCKQFWCVACSPQADQALCFASRFFRWILVTSLKHRKGIDDTECSCAGPATAARK